MLVLVLMLVQMLMWMCWRWCLCGSAGPSAGNSGTSGGGGGSGGGSYRRCVIFFTNNPNHNHDYERGQKGGNPKCDAFKSGYWLVLFVKK